MSIFNSFLRSKEIPRYNVRQAVESMLFDAAHSGISYFLMEKNSNRRNASFEVLLFNSQHILQVVHRKASNAYSEIEKRYFTELFNYSSIHGFDKIIPVSLSAFINKRFELYYNEMISLQDIEGYIPSRTIYNFYDNPLQLDSKLSDNMLKVFEFIIALGSVKTMLENSVDFIIGLRY